MKQTFAKIIIAMMMLNVILMTVPQSTKAESPYQDIVGEDYIQEAYNIEALVLSKAGRKTSNVTDGASWNNRTWYQDISSEYLISDNGLYAGYNSTNMSVGGGANFSVATGNDDFDDEQIGSEWVEVDHPSYNDIEEGWNGTLSMNDSVIVARSIYKYDYSNENNYSVRMWGYSNTSWVSTNHYWGGLAIHGTNETIVTNVETSTFMKVYMYAEYRSGSLRYYIVHYNQTHVKYYWNNLTTSWSLVRSSAYDVGAGKEFMPNVTFTVEFNSTLCNLSLYDHNNNWRIVADSVQRSSLWYGMDNKRIVLLGQIDGVAIIGQVQFYNYTQVNGPTSGNYISPAFLLGNSDTVFDQITGTGTDNSIYIRTSNDRQMLFPSDWHKVDANTHYYSSAWAGAYIQFNISLDNAEYFDMDTFETLGSSNGWYWNQSETICVDRSFDWYGLNIEFTKDLWAFNDSVGNFIGDQWMNFTKCDVDYSNHSIKIDNDIRYIECYINYINSTLINTSYSFVNLTLSHYDYFNLSVNVDNCSISQLRWLRMDAKNGGKVTMKDTYMFTRKFHNSIGLKYSYRNHVFGGKNLTKFGGINSQYAKYNYIDLPFGGNGLVYSHSSNVGNGTSNEVCNISYNYINRPNYVGLGSYGGDVTEPFDPSGFKNGSYGTFYKNYVNNTRKNPSAGIGYALSFGYGEENSTFKHCYVFNVDDQATASSYIHHTSVFCGVVDCIFYNCDTAGVKYQDGSFNSIVWGNYFINVSGICINHNTGVDYCDNSMGNNTFINCTGTSVVFIGDHGFNVGNDTFINCDGVSYNVTDNASMNIWNSVTDWHKIDSGEWGSYIYNYKLNIYRLDEVDIRVVVKNESDTAVYDQDPATSKTHRVWLIVTDVENGTYTNHTYTSYVYVEPGDVFVYRNGVKITYSENSYYIYFTQPSGATFVIHKSPLFGGVYDMFTYSAELMSIVALLFILMMIVLICAKGYEWLKKEL